MLISLSIKYWYITIKYHICNICNRKLYVSFWYSDSVWCKKWRKNRCHNFQWVKGKGKGLGLLMEMIILVDWNIKCAFKHIWVNSMEIWSVQAHLNQIHTFLKQKDLQSLLLSLKNLRKKWLTLNDWISGQKYGNHQHLRNFVSKGHFCWCLNVFI